MTLDIIWRTEAEYYISAALFAEASRTHAITSEPATPAAAALLAARDLQAALRYTTLLCKMAQIQYDRVHANVNAMLTHLGMPDLAELRRPYFSCQLADLPLSLSTQGE